MGARTEIVLFAVAAVSLAAAASGHAVIYKREPRSATLWLLVAWLMPIVGPALYFFFGVNRVKREAAALRRDMVRHRTRADGKACDGDGVFLPVESTHLLSLAALGRRVTDRQLLPGNHIEPLVDGAEAYPAMLEAIEGARESIGFSTYIFDAVGIGEKFIEALARAHKRGVEMRALVDAVGARYCRPRIFGVLKARGIPVALFNPPLINPWVSAFNLRNHRKVLVVDGRTGFVGGFNIKREYWAGERNVAPFRDLHFRVRGPVVAHLAEVFVDDWQFTTGEELRGVKWFPALAASPSGGPARGIEDGPDEDVDPLRWVIIGAINCARKSIRIATPYYLPDSAILSALSAAALRGVQVDVLLPAKSNLVYVHWAMMGQLWQTLERGCRVFLSEGPFDHSKIFVVDSSWTMIGSANWDNRSLRLNFEFTVESFDPAFAFRMDQVFDSRLAGARQVTLADVDGRAVWVKLRDGVARLFTPYL